MYGSLQWNFQLTPCYFEGHCGRKQCRGHTAKDTGTVQWQAGKMTLEGEGGLRTGTWDRELQLQQYFVVKSLFGYVLKENSFTVNKLFPY